MSRYIDADKLNPDCMFNKNGTRGFAISQSQIANAPTADVQPIIHAKWVIDNEEIHIGARVYQRTFWYDCHCSNCGYKQAYTTDKEDSLPCNYCPNCGAKMIELQESEDNK